MKFPRRELTALLLTAGAAAMTVGCTQQQERGGDRAAATATTAENTTAAAAAPAATAELIPTPSASPRRQLDVPYVPTHQEVVDEMLRMAEVKGGDVLYDLGSGDGRIPITAAKRYGTRGVGIDINPERITEANANAQKAGVTDKVRFIEGDLFKEDFSEATVVTLYLLPDVNLKLRPKLEAMRPGTRIVSHNYGIGDWEPERTKQVTTPDKSTHYLYFWRVPERKSAKQ